MISKNQDNSFRKLFNYISGHNKTGQKIQMTRPVTEIKKESFLKSIFLNIDQKYIIIKKNREIKFCEKI